MAEAPDPADRTAAALSVTVEAVDAAAMAPYGWLLGKPFPDGENEAAFRNRKTAFWREHLFDPGDHGQAEILWVEYRDDDPLVDRLEQHPRTQQAVVPLRGGVVQVVALSAEDGAPDISSLRAYRLHPGVGFCMRPGVWHASRSASATCLMLTRRSTTLDLVRGLKLGVPSSETALRAIHPIRLVEASGRPWPGAPAG